MRKEHTFRIHPLAVLLALMAWWLSIPIVSCTSDDSGAPPSSEEAAPLRFTLSVDDYTETRGVVSNSMDESVGLFAYVFEDNIETPNFMYNEEMQFNGTQWQTVNTFDRPEANQKMRFYAYYPYGLPEDVLILSGATQTGAPDFTYVVPKDISAQVDLMAGKSVADISSNDVRTAGAIAITVSHLLTAVKFQVGECKEAGRVTKIEMKRVLDRNDYRLSETEENVLSDPDDPTSYVVDPANPGQYLTTPVIDGWKSTDYSDNKSDFSDFSAELNQKVTLTKMEVVEGTNVVVPQPLLTDENAFLMLPQTLPTGATLEVTYNCGGSDHVLTASLAGMKWLQGKTVTYTLDIKSLTRLTVRSEITPWTQHETIDGVASDGITILMDTGIDDWTGHETNAGSDDPRTNP